MEFLLIISPFIFLVSIAGVIYPFRPFKRRKNALMWVGLSFATFTVAAFSGAGAPQSNDTKSANGVAQKTVEVENAPNGAASKVETKTDEPKVDPTLLTEAEVKEVWKQFERRNWSQVGSLLWRYNNRGADTESILAELESRTLEIVKPLPASDHDGNLAGYLLLSKIRPENSTYSDKVDEYKERIQSARLASVKRLRKKEDKVSGVTWYQHPNQPRYTNSRSTAYFYLGRKGDAGRPWLRMRVQFTANKWLFVEEVVAWHDGVTEPLISGYFERDHNSDIWEWMDVNPDDYQILVLRSLADADEAILRFKGRQYHKDVTLSAKDKKAIREVLEAYDVMRGNS